MGCRNVVLGLLMFFLSPNRQCVLQSLESRLAALPPEVHLRRTKRLTECMLEFWPPQVHAEAKSGTSQVLLHFQLKFNQPRELQCLGLRDRALRVCWTLQRDSSNEVL